MMLYSYALVGGSDKKEKETRESSNLNKQDFLRAQMTNVLQFLQGSYFMKVMEGKSFCFIFALLATPCKFDLLASRNEISHCFQPFYWFK